MAENAALGEWIETGAVAFGLWGLFGLMLYGMRWMYRPLLDSTKTISASVNVKPVPVDEGFKYKVEETKLENLVDGFMKLFNCQQDVKGIVKAASVRALEESARLRYWGWGMRQMPDGYPTWMKQLEKEPGSPGFELPTDSRPGVLVLAHVDVEKIQGGQRLSTLSKSSSIFILFWMLLFSKDSSEHTRSIRVRIAEVLKEWHEEGQSGYAVVLVYDSEIFCELLPKTPDNGAVYDHSFDADLFKGRGKRSLIMEDFKPKDTTKFDRSAPRINLLDVHDIVCTYKDGDVIVETSTWVQFRKAALFSPSV